MDYDDHLEAIRREGARFGDALQLADPDLPVPTCPEWVVRDLAHHLGGVHRWAAAYVRDAHRDPLSASLEEVAGGWPQDGELVNWFHEGHAALVDAFAAAPADLACWTFLAAPSPREMWARRQAHETAIHRADVESAIGSMTPYPPAFAADGIDELLVSFLTRPGRGPTWDRSSSIRFQPDDIDAVWTMTLGTDGHEVKRQDEAADLIVSGSASDLYLLVWNRRDTAGLGVSGDIEMLDRWRQRVRIRWR